MFSRAAGIPWYLWCAALAVTSAMVGVHWDISWHRSIGRDTFWTPAHIAIYLCGILAGVSCGYLILATTFGSRPKLREVSVRMWGFRGPLGAFIAAWGGVAMLTSAPFDDWWHNAYGLDVKILSPPHTVLALGMIGVAVGALILILGHMNRAEGDRRRGLHAMFLYLGGMLVVHNLTLSLEYISHVLQHSAVFYRATALVAPVVLAATARASGWRWGATATAAVYTVFWVGINWILQVFPAEPKLGPVHYRVTHLVPSYFPILLIFPAAVLDLIWAWRPDWSRWRKGVVAGAAFVATLVAVQWPFAYFLMSPAARNWFFYTDRFDYLTRPSSYTARFAFYAWEKSTAEFWANMAFALAASMLFTWLGLVWGDWMRRVRR